MACFIPDSNVFLQCRPLEELDWSALTPDPIVELVVVAQVYRELDRLKQDRNARRSRRARHWTQRLRPVALGESESVVLRASGPRLLLKLAPRLPPGALAGDALDLSIADERIVAEALAYAQRSSGDVTLLSDDGMAVRAARDNALPAVYVPEAWRADPEPDEGQRRLAELERQVAGLARQTPAVQVRAAVELTGVPRLEGEYILWPELSPAFIENALTRIRAVHPGPRDAHVSRATMQLVGSAIDYGQANHERWIHTLEQQLRASARLASGWTDPFVAQLVFENMGGAGADDLVVDVHARGDVRLVELAELAELREKLADGFPAPPAPRSVFGLGAMSESILGPLPRIPVVPVMRGARAVSEFDWSFDAPQLLSAFARGDCPEFRHGLQPEIFEFGLRPPLEARGDVEGSLQVRVSARNLGDTPETIVPVRLRCRMGDTEQRVSEQLAADLDVHL